MKKTHSWIKLIFDRGLSKNVIAQFMALTVLVIILLVIFYVPLLACCRTDLHEYCNKIGINEFILPFFLLIDPNAFSNLYMENCWVGLTIIIFCSLIFLLGIVIFNGAMVGIITNFIERRVANHKAGLIHYLKSGHYIIMEWDELVPSIIMDIFKKDKDAYILLMSATKSEELHEKLLKVFDEKRLKHIIINYGHCTSKDYYKDIHLESAVKVYIAGLRTLRSHDAINVECVDSICTYLEQPEIKSRPMSITCVFEDLDTYAAFKTTEIFTRVKNLNIDFVPYNFYEGWARQVLVRQYYTDRERLDAKIQYPPVYGILNTHGEHKQRYVHLVFVGTTNFAVAFAMEAAHVLHFPNSDNAKTRITFIDKNADIEKDEFIIRNRHFFEVQSYFYCDLSKSKEYTPELESGNLYFSPQRGYERADANFLDVEFEFIKGDVFSPNVQDVICRWAQEHNSEQNLSLFLATSNQRHNFVLGMNMPDAVYDNEVPIFIRQDHSDNFVSNLREASESVRTDPKYNTYAYLEEGKTVPTVKVAGGRYAHIYPFGMNETAYSEDENSLKNAKLINYLYSLYFKKDPGISFQSILEKESMSEHTMWKNVDSEWQSLSVAYQWSNLYNAYTFGIKLAVLRSMRNLNPEDTSQDHAPLNDNEIEVIARMEHNRWNVEKLLMGYRKAHKNEDKYNQEESIKEILKQNKNRYIHHDIRPFDQLEDGIDNLDREFSKCIPWIIKMTENANDSSLA